ncbi:MAG TPA: hypothetical protein VJR06_07185 [Nitrososphaerales archaeon]|nr:hypothetical protein [Nitrososphaerales archaeon]
MPGCKHESLEFVGEQKTDDGVNSYYRCKACDALLVVMPSQKVMGIPGGNGDQPSRAGANPS